MSNLNCKQGDLAVLVNALHPENIGKFVTVVSPLGYREANDVVMCNNEPFKTNGPGFYWCIEGQYALATTKSVSGRAIQRKYGIISDANLRPIRDNDGEDETLSWLPSPTKETS